MAVTTVKMATTNLKHLQREEKSRMLSPGENILFLSFSFYVFLQSITFRGLFLSKYGCAKLLLYY
jgi:hypothetical protein